MELGMVGLGRMGGNMAQRLISGGHTVVAFDPSEEARESFETAYRATGKPLDVGKSCIRFKQLDDLPLDLIGECIASETVDTFVASCKKA